MFCRMISLLRKGGVRLCVIFKKIIISLKKLNYGIEIEKKVIVIFLAFERAGVPKFFSHEINSLLGDFELWFA